MPEYITPFMLTSTMCNVPVPFTEKQPHDMLLQPLYFTVGMVFLETDVKLFFLQT